MNKINKKMKIIPVFVPHVGCPNDCVFCNQKRITGKGSTIVDGGYVGNIIEEYKKTIDDDVYTELAFFGGSFTAIDLHLQEELLRAGKEYKDKGILHSIRCSTRPDAIDEDILNLQKKYGMDIIELGIQSLDDEVLRLSNRGHTRVQSENASRLIKEHGFVLGHQVMPGLPGSSREKDLKTCIDSIKMQPDIVRIYPTLIIKDTDLVRMYENGEYRPLTLDEAVDISALVYSIYSVNNINVIRIGLQNTENINEENDVVAGPFHEAFRQLVEEKIYLHSIINTLKDVDLTGRHLVFSADKRLISYIAGQNKSNIKLLKEKFSVSKITFINEKDSQSIEIFADNIKAGSFLIKDIYKNYLSFHQGELCF
ncbi:radical SAM protein [Sedimentibacter sp.]|uniref:elongator complex protein 3 n=1 Tax=Sedimentibacter sp. TaxID=1960295 RepID=UPI00289F12C8|nr:radical SAM protein [Sedimentibacter sp.]